MRTNYYNIRLAKTEAIVYRYPVSFEKDDGLSRARKRRYIELLLQQNPFAKVTHYSDLSANIFTLEKLKLPSKDRAEYRVVIYERLEAPFPAPAPNQPPGVAASRARKTRKLLVQFSTSYDLNDLYKYVSAPRGGNYAAKGDVVQAMNIIFNHATGVHQRVAAQPNNKFFPLADDAALGAQPFNVRPHPNYESWVLGEGLIAIRGYYSSVRLGAQRVLLNVNVSTGAFYEAIRLDQLMEKFMGGRAFSDDTHARLCADFIKRLKVATRYLKEKDAKGVERPSIKIRTVNGFVKHPYAQASNKARFDYTENGSTTNITVQDYFARKHGVTLTRPDLPAINCGTDEELMLIPPELCFVIAGQPARRLLSPSQTSVMIGFAGRPPNANAASIETSGLQVMQVASNQQANTVGKAGLQMNTNMITVPGRILPAVAIKFQKILNTRDGGWNLAGQKFFKPSTMKGIFSGLQILLQGRPVRTSDFSRGMRTVASELQKYGVIYQTYREPTAPVTLPSLDRADFARIMASLDAKFSAASKINVRFILISIPEKNAILYAIVKYLGDYKYGINTILVQDSNMAKISPADGSGDLMLVANLALKFSIKSGGQPWALNPSDLPLIKKKTMVIGLDVTHPSPTSKKGAPSIAAIAFSKDPTLSAWFADGMSQTSRKEMIEGLPQLLSSAIKVWQKHNPGQPPDEILVFRDGVSEGQFAQVLGIEFPLMQKAFEQIYGKTKHPKVSIIVSNLSSLLHSKMLMFCRCVASATTPVSFQPRSRILMLVMAEGRTIRLPASLLIVTLPAMARVHGIYICSPTRPCKVQLNHATTLSSRMKSA
jgi:hypothetical protein